jgi:uncharacterized protein (TIGR02270 family)
MILIDILEEHLEEADFLFQQRENALSDRVYDLDGLAELEERLLAHLDGLLLGEKEAWKLLEPKLAGGELGACFAAAFVALESGDATRIALVQKTFFEAEETVLEGIRHALRHTSVDVEKMIRPLFNSGQGAVRAAAIEVAGFRRMPLETKLLHAGLTGKEPLVIAASLTAVGRLRIFDLKNEVETLLESDAPPIRLAALRAGRLLNSEKALIRCRKSVLEQSEEAGEALFLLGLAGRAEDGSLLVNAVNGGGLARNAVTSLGLLGRVAAVDILIQCLADSKLARLAGQAICTLTGVDLEKEKLVAPKAEAQTEADEDDFEVDPDEGLLIPDPAKMESWWRKNASRLDKKIRYRKGLPYSPPLLIDLLRAGTLPERHHAAMELVLSDPARSFLETHAFAGRQGREMARLK